MNYFYVRNRNFVAVFKKSETAVSCQVIPSPALEKKIKDHPSLKYKEEKCNLANPEDEENEGTNNPADKQDDDSDDIDIEEDKLNPNINFKKDHNEMNTQYFRLLLKDSYKMYTFADMHVQSFFNLLANFIGQKLEI